MDTATIPQQSSRATGPVIVGLDQSSTATDAVVLGQALAEALESELIPARSAAKGLRTLAEREGASAIVIGSASASTLGRLVAGSAIPVAVAPAGYSEIDPRIAAIGVGFDGSETSRAALRWASGVARGADATLRIIGVHEPVPVDRFALTKALASPPFSAVVREQQEKRLAIGAAEVGDGLAVEPQLRDGTTADVLVDVSRTLDLLVLGTRGLGRIRGAVLGSVSAAVVRAAHSPVGVVPSLAQ